jgi:hypothetical protein
MAAMAAHLLLRQLKRSSPSRTPHTFAGLSFGNALACSPKQNAFNLTGDGKDKG